MFIIPVCYAQWEGHRIYKATILAMLVWRVGGTVKVTERERERIVFLNVFLAVLDCLACGLAVV